jgi:hypothetical protein
MLMPAILLRRTQSGKCGSGQCLLFYTQGLASGKSIPAILLDAHKSSRSRRITGLLSHRIRLMESLKPHHRRPFREKAAEPAYSLEYDTFSSPV